jgi:hypothetical protein
MSVSNLFGVTDGGVNLSLPHFQALKASQSLALNANYLTAYDSKSGPLADQFDLAAGTFTPKKNGIYLITGRGTCNAGVPSANNFIFSIRGPAGETLSSLPMQGYTGGEIGPVVSSLILLSTTQNYRLSFFQTLLNPLPLTNIIYSCILLAEV